MQNSIHIGNNRFFAWKIDATDLTVEVRDGDNVICAQSLYSSSYPLLRPGSPTEQTLMREMLIKISFDRSIELAGDIWYLSYDVDASYYTALHDGHHLEFRLEQALYQEIKNIYTDKQDRLKKKAKKIKQKLQGIAGAKAALTTLLIKSYQ
jgi:hypothetical protein